MINSLPVMKNYNTIIDNCVNIVDKILCEKIDLINGQNEINSLILKQYKLSEDEINIIEGE